MTRKRKRLRPLKNRRLKIVIWVGDAAVGVWFDERKQLLRIAGHMNARELGNAVLQLARDNAKSLGIPNSDGPAKYQIVGGNRWRLTMPLPRCRGIIDLVERSVRAGKISHAQVKGPLRALGRLAY